MFLLYVVLGLIITLFVLFAMMVFRRSDPTLRFLATFPVSMVMLYGLSFLFGVDVTLLSLSYLAWSAFMALVFILKMER